MIMATLGQNGSRCCASLRPRLPSSRCWSIRTVPISARNPRCAGRSIRPTDCNCGSSTPARRPNSMPPFRRSTRKRPDALLIGGDPFCLCSGKNRREAARSGLVAVYPIREFVEAGGLISYGASIRKFLPPGRHLCRPHPQGRQADRPAGGAADHVRAGDQPQGRQGAGHRDPAGLHARSDEVIE